MLGVYHGGYGGREAMLGMYYPTTLGYTPPGYTTLLHPPGYTMPASYTHCSVRHHHQRPDAAGR